MGEPHTSVVQMLGSFKVPSRVAGHNWPAARLTFGIGTAAPPAAVASSSPSLKKPHSLPPLANQTPLPPNRSRLSHELRPQRCSSTALLSAGEKSAKISRYHQLRHQEEDHHTSTCRSYIFDQACPHNWGPDPILDCRELRITQSSVAPGTLG